MAGPVLPFEIDLDAIQALPESEREEVAAQLHELRGRMEHNPLWGFLPHRGEQQYRETHCARCSRASSDHIGADHPFQAIGLTGSESRGQVEFLELTKRDIFLGAIVASNRFGKTHINIVEAAVQTLPWDLVPPWLHRYKVLDPDKRDIRMRFIGPDLKHWLGTSIHAKLRELIPRAALKGGKFDGKGGAWNDRDQKLTFADGSFWDFLTHDMELDAFSSVELDAARFDEEPTGAAGERIYDETVRGLVDRDGYVRFTLTPVEGIGWLFSELSDEHDDPRQDDEVHVIGGDIDHNPHLSEKGKAQAIKRWERSGELDQRKRGLWKHREGLIFPEFKRRLEVGPLDSDPPGHLRPDRPLRDPGGAGGRYPIDASGQWRVPVFESIDPGINVDHPFALTVAFLNTPATDPYGREDMLEIFFGVKFANTIVAEQAQVIHDLRAALGYRPQFTVIDPAAQNRNPATGLKLQKAFQNEGIHTILGQNSRELTYNELRGRLVDMRLVIWASLDALIGDEFSSYRWKRASGRTEDVAKPEPIKRNDDLIDTLRYMVVRIPIWRTGRALGPEEDMSPRKRLARESLRELRTRHKRKGKVGGVW